MATARRREREDRPADAGADAAALDVEDAYRGQGAHRGVAVGARARAPGARQQEAGGHDGDRQDRQGRHDKAQNRSCRLQGPHSRS